MPCRISYCTFVFLPFSFRSAKDRRKGENLEEIRTNCIATITINLIDRSSNVHQLIQETRLTSPFHISPRGWKNISYSVKLNLVRENLISSRDYFSNIIPISGTANTFIRNLNCKIKISHNDSFEKFLKNFIFPNLKLFEISLFSFLFKKRIKIIHCWNCYIIVIFSNFRKLCASIGSERIKWIFKVRKGLMNHTWWIKEHSIQKFIQQKNRNRKFVYFFSCIVQTCASFYIFFWRSKFNLISYHFNKRRFFIKENVE